MDALPAPLEPLDEDRRRVFTILDLLEESVDPTTRADLASELVRSCSRYEDIKSRVLYPALRAHLSDQGEIDRAEDDQRVVRDALSEIRSRTQNVKPAYAHTDDPEGFEIALNHLIDSIRAHVEHEDEMLLPKLTTLDKEASDELRSEIEHAVAHASTHPHPPHNPLARAFVAIEEKLERKVKDESTPWHPGVKQLEEALDPAAGDGTPHNHSESLDE